MMVAGRIKRQDRIAWVQLTLERPDPCKRPVRTRHGPRNAGTPSVLPPSTGSRSMGQPLKGPQLGWLGWFDGHTRHLNAKIRAQCTVGPTRRLNIREECCLQAKSTTEKVVTPCYTMVSRTWRGMLHDNMVTMWVHISERVSPWGCAISGCAGWRPKEAK